MYSFGYIYPDDLNHIKLKKKTKIKLNFLNNRAYHISLELKNKIPNEYLNF